MKTLLLSLILACMPVLRAQSSDRPAHRGGVLAPALIHKVEAEYPPAARRKGLEGVAVLSAEIGKDGVPIHVRVLQTLDPVLDKNAVEALKQWRFRPAEAEGKPVSTEAKIEFQFHLPKFAPLPDSSVKAEEEPVQDNDPVFPILW